MTRSLPSPAIEWLIEGLAEREVRVTPTKLERVQSSGLAPRPIAHRHSELEGADLWPQGALEHYAVVIPLIRQRHHATLLAAITMVGWGYPVDIDLLHHAYKVAFSSALDPPDLRDAMLMHYQNKGMPMVKSGISHLRSHGNYPVGTSADDLGYDFLDSITNLAAGTATENQLNTLLTAILPKSAEAPKQVQEFLLAVYGRLQSHMSLSSILESALNASLDDLLAVQPEAAKDVRSDLDRFGGTPSGCAMCDETMGLMVGAALPWHFRVTQLDLESLLPDSLLEILK